MLALLSPSKTLDFTTCKTSGKALAPALLSDSEILIKELKKLKEEDIAKLMGISKKLAKLNYERFQQFSVPFTKKNSKQAIKAFKGDVYEGLAADSFTENDFKEAHEKIAILSGLYGLIKPLDLIQPYRLEMGTKLKNPRGKNLYEFWGAKITEEINKLEKDILVNLASDEYFKVVNTSKLKAKLLKTTFKEKKGKNYKVIGLFAKKARGMMARFIIKNRIKNIDDLKKFTDSGYKFNPLMSTASELVFVR